MNRGEHEFMDGDLDVFQIIDRLTEWERKSNIVLVKSVSTFGVWRHKNEEFILLVRRKIQRKNMQLLSLPAGARDVARLEPPIMTAYREFNEEVPIEINMRMNVFDAYIDYGNSHICYFMDLSSLVEKLVVKGVHKSVAMLRDQKSDEVEVMGFYSLRRMLKQAIDVRNGKRGWLMPAVSNSVLYYYVNHFPFKNIPLTVSLKMAEQLAVDKSKLFIFHISVTLLATSPKVHDYIEVDGSCFVISSVMNAYLDDIAYQNLVENNVRTRIQRGDSVYYHILADDQEYRYIWVLNGRRVCHSETAVPDVFALVYSSTRRNPGVA
jgi:8-oxo-dGTP pyrophosphatase MutT (NUDIX family)